MSRFEGAHAVIPASGGLGVLAAAQDLHREGITVICGSPATTSPLRFSRSVTWSADPLPSSGNIAASLEWLLRAVPEGSMATLVPAPDELTWLAADRQAELRDRYRLYYPAGDVVYGILHKERLFAAAQEYGVGRKIARRLHPSLARAVALSS